LITCCFDIFVKKIQDFIENKQDKKFYNSGKQIPTVPISWPHNILTFDSGAQGF
jgi:hypothetical protein